LLPRSTEIQPCVAPIRPSPPNPKKFTKSPPPALRLGLISHVLGGVPSQGDEPEQVSRPPEECPDPSHSRKTAQTLCMWCPDAPSTLHDKSSPKLLIHDDSATVMNAPSVPPRTNVLEEHFSTIDPISKSETKCPDCNNTRWLPSKRHGKKWVGSDQKLPPRRLEQHM
jgi:hypothetical protein